MIDTGSYTADYFDSKYISAQTRKFIERDQKRNEELKPQDDPELLAFQAKYPPGTMFYDEDTEEVFKVDQIVWIDKLILRRRKSLDGLYLVYHVMWMAQSEKIATSMVC